MTLLLRLARAYSYTPRARQLLSRRMGISANPATKAIKTPAMGESITEGTLTSWHKSTFINQGVGDFVARDEQVATIETDKIDVQVNSPEAGKVTKLCASEGDTVTVGSDLFEVEPGTAPAGTGTAKKTAAPVIDIPQPPAKQEEKKSQPKPVAPVKTTEASKPQAAPSPVAAAPTPAKAPMSTDLDLDNFPGTTFGSRGEKRVKMNRMRLRIAERLKESQNTAASLTTFNEIDMSALMALRSKYKENVLETHNVKLGFMGAFVKACAHALHAVPAVNARIEGDSIVFNDYVDVSVAVATPKGLVTPVLRNCESLSIVQVEAAIAALGKKVLLVYTGSR